MFIKKNKFSNGFNSFFYYNEKNFVIKKFKNSFYLNGDNCKHDFDINLLIKLKKKKLKMNLKALEIPFSLAVKVKHDGFFKFLD